MWRTSESPPLDAAEQLRVYLMQCQIGAVKRCRRCGRTKAVYEFAGFGRLTCWGCGEFTAAPQMKAEQRFYPGALAARGAAIA